MAITPFMIVVIIPEFAEMLFEFIRDEVDISPLTILVKVLIAELREF